MTRDAIRLDGKVAIVTGGAGGIGSVTAGLLVARGASVVIADIVEERAQAVAATLPNAVAMHLDLASEDSVTAMIASTMDRFGRLDILHNNAALQGPDITARDVDIEHIGTDLWDRTFAVNVRGPMIACREALPHLRVSRGNIVNMVSSLALQGHIIQTALVHRRRR